MRFGMRKRKNIHNPAPNGELPGFFHKIYALKVQLKKVLI